MTEGNLLTVLTYIEVSVETRVVLCGLLHHTVTGCLGASFPYVANSRCGLDSKVMVTFVTLVTLGTQQVKGK